MRASLALIAVAALSTSVIAQTTVFNPANSYDRSTEFTSRGSNGGTPGHVSQAFAYGNSAGLQTLTRSRYVMQDQDQSTREPWNVGTTLLNAKGQPDYAGLRTYGTNLLLPAGQSGIGAWILTHTALATTPHLINHGTEQWHHVWQFTVPTNWTTDGLSVHMSQGATYRGTLLCFQNTRHREIPRTDGSPAAQIIEKHGWSGVARNPDPAPINRTWRLESFFGEVVLNGASDNTVYNCAGSLRNPNQGYARIDPDFDDTGAGSPVRTDNYRWTVEAGSNWNGGVAVMFWSTTTFPGKVPTPFGDLYLNLLDPLFAAGPQLMGAITGGKASLSLNLGAANNPLRGVIANLPNFSGQAVVASQSAGVKLSTLMSFRGKLVPTGFTAGTAVSGTPASISKRVADRNIVVRNDGAGTLTVQAKRGSTNIGPATVVPERTAVRITLPVAASSVAVSSNKSTATDFVYGYNR